MIKELLGIAKINLNIKTYNFGIINKKILKRSIERLVPLVINLIKYK